MQAHSMLTCRAVALGRARDRQRSPRRSGNGMTRAKRGAIGRPDVGPASKTKGKAMSLRDHVNHLGWFVLFANPLVALGCGGATQSDIDEAQPELRGCTTLAQGEEVALPESGRQMREVLCGSNGAMVAWRDARGRMQRPDEALREENRLRRERERDESLRLADGGNQALVDVWFHVDLDQFSVDDDQNAPSDEEVSQRRDKIREELRRKRSELIAEVQSIRGVSVPMAC